MRFVSLDTAATEPYNKSIARLMSERPTPADEHIKIVRTKSGNLVQPRSR